MKRILFLTAVILSALMLIVSCDNKNNEPEAKTYKVIFNPDNGSDIFVVDVKEGEKVEKPADPEKAGYSFKEWQLNDKAYDFESPVTSDLILKAEWITKYKVTFDYDNGYNLVTEEVNAGGKVIKPDNPEKEGSTFDVWQVDGETYNFESPVTSDITIKATWTKLKYKVTFDTNGGTPEPIDTQEIEYGGKAKKPDNPSIASAKFVGWFYDDDKQFDFSTLITRDYDLKAGYSIVSFSYSYTVTFNIDGNTTAVAAQGIKEGEKASKPATDPVNKYKTFKFWSADGTNEFSFETAINNDITLYAVWEELYTIGGIGPAGGYIFYDCDADNTETDAGPDNLHSSIAGWRFLEAAPNDLDGYFLFGYYRKDGSNSVVGTYKGIGKGKENTENLVNAMGEEAYIDVNGTKKGRYAALACYEYTSIYNGVAISDWFLPTIEELLAMHANLYMTKVDSFPNNGYLSSTEDDSQSVSDVWFWNYGSVSDNSNAYRYSNRKVRPVRRF